MRLWHSVGATALAITGLMVALSASWLVLARFDFSYGFWHDHAGIGSAIDRFAPTNLYRHGFHLTTRDERIALFAGINAAIHDHGAGLEALSYRVPGQPEQSLLREPEIVHLKDVAHLIDLARMYMAGAAVVWLALWLYCIFALKPPPSLGSQLVGTLVLIIALTVLVVALGPVDVFYALHVWLFPEGHQWFFYYQDSLMSTMMFAPQLFGWIALEWLVLAVVSFVILQVGAGKLVSKIQTFKQKSRERALPDVLK